MSSGVESVGVSPLRGFLRLARFKFLLYNVLPVGLGILLDDGPVRGALVLVGVLGLYALLFGHRLWLARRLLAVRA